MNKHTFPSSQRRGGATAARLTRRVVSLAETFRRSDHPVCAASLLAVGASTPPLRGGEYSLLNHNFLISPQRPRKRSPQKYLDQMPFVFRRALLVVDHVGRLSECFSGQGQIALDFGAGAGQEVFRGR